MISRRTVATALATAPAAILPLLPRATRAAPETTLDRIRRTRTIRYGVVNGQPPYCSKDLVTGEWRGFIVDMVKDLGATLGATPQPVESNWGSAVLELQADKVDVFFGLAPSPERARVVDFTKPLYQNAFALVARRGFQPKTWSDLDLPEVRIALEIGSVYDLNVAGLVPNATIIRLKSNNEALLTVQSGHADCQMLVIVFALTQLTRNPGLGHLVVPEPLFGSTTNGAVAREAEPRWRAYVDAWIDERRGAGLIRKMLVDNLAMVGVKPEDVPPQLLF
jgi:polar amino acid transport system substrate-binding protein